MQGPDCGSGLRAGDFHLVGVCNDGLLHLRCVFILELPGLYVQDFRVKLLTFLIGPDWDVQRDAGRGVLWGLQRIKQPQVRGIDQLVSIKVDIVSLNSAKRLTENGRLRVVRYELKGICLGRKLRSLELARDQPPIPHGRGRKNV